MKFEVEKGEFGKIKVVGVGGAGIKVVDEFIRKSGLTLETIAIDTSSKSLQNTLSPLKIQVGREGESIFYQSRDFKEEVSSYLEGSELVFIISGMGGIAGSLLSPYVARFSKELGALTLAVAILPFSFEGKSKRQRSLESKEFLKKEASALLIFPNDLFFRIFSSLPCGEFFKKVNSIVTEVISSLIEPLIQPSLLDFDLVTLRKVLEDAQEVKCGWGEGEGEDRALRSVEKALSSPLWEKREERKIRKLLVSIVGGEDLSMEEISRISDYLSFRIHPEAEVTFGTVFKKDVSEVIKITLFGVTSVGEGSIYPLKSKTEPYLWEE